MNKMHSAAGVAMLGVAMLLAPTAQAAVTIGTTTYTSPVNLGTVTGPTLALGDFLSNSNTAATLTFYDNYVFTLSAPTNLTLLSTSINFLVPGSITGLTERLFSGAATTFTGGTTDPFPAATAIATSTPSGLSFANLAAGTYTLEFTGVLPKATTVPILGTNVPAVATYGALVGLATPAVPEPGTWGLLAAGLGALGALRLRRRAH